MPRRAQSSQRASYFHVLNRNVRRPAFFTEPADYRAFLSILSEAVAQHPVRLIAYSLMPNHWHLVLGETDPLTLSRCLHWVSSTQVSQGRFTSMEIPAVGDLVRVSRYVEREALQAGLVRRAQDWPWCSLAERLQETPRVPLVNAPFLCSRAWTDYVNCARSGDSRLDHFAETPGRFA